MRILAIIPAYNEEDCIEQTVRSLVAACPDIDYLVINDGSTDNTGAICRRNHLRHVSLPVNSGLTAAFQTGMKYAERHGYDAAVQFDADGQHLPEYIPAMAQKMEEDGANVVIASRILAGEKLAGTRSVGSKLIAALIRLTSRTSLSDPTSGMRMFDRKLIHRYARSFDLAPEPDAIALFAREGMRIAEVPAKMLDRQGGVSYLGFTSSIRYMLRTCFSILLFQWFR